MSKQVWKSEQLNSEQWNIFRQQSCVNLSFALSLLLFAFITTELFTVFNFSKYLLAVDENSKYRPKCFHVTQNNRATIQPNFMQHSISENRIRQEMSQSIKTHLSNVIIFLVSMINCISSCFNHQQLQFESKWKQMEIFYQSLFVSPSHSISIL